MKKEYFITINGEKKGAYTFEELVKLDIYDESMVWKAGWDNWRKVTDIEELKDFIILTPPPTESEIKIHKKYEFLNRYKIKIRNTIKKFLIVTLIANVVWNIVFFLIAKDGGSDMFPIYLTREERDNPFLIFWNMLPTNLVMVTAILLFCYFIYIVIVANKKDTISANSQNKIQEIKNPKSNGLGLNIGVFFIMLLFTILSIMPLFNLILVKLLRLEVFKKANFYFLFIINIILSIVMFFFFLMGIFIFIREARYVTLLLFLPAFIIFTYNSIRVYKERNQAKAE